MNMCTLCNLYGCPNNLDPVWYSYKHHRIDNGDGYTTRQNYLFFIYSMSPIKDDIQSSFEEWY